MALSMSVTVKDNFQKDILFEDAYITVDTISGGKDSVLATVIFRDGKGGIIIQTKQYLIPISISTINFIEQCYQHIKLIDYFSGSRDC